MRLWTKSSSWYVNQIQHYPLYSTIMHDLRLNTDFSSAKDIWNRNLRTVCELSTDLEGVKLDAIITESKLSKHIHTNYENINKNMKLIEKISHELAIMQCEQQDHFRIICKQDFAINQLIRHSEAIQSEQGKNNQQISEQYTSIEQIREGLWNNT